MHLDDQIKEGKALSTTRVKTPKTGLFTNGSCLSKFRCGGWAFAWVVRNKLIIEALGPALKT